jgi:hypothetical protein
MFAAATTTQSGALYLGGSGCCGSQVHGYLVRVSAKGKLDDRFTRATRRSLGELGRLNTLEESVNGVVARSDGTIDVLGSGGYEKGFLLRLRPNGKPRSKFAKQGLRVLPFPVTSAALGSDGAIDAVSDENLTGEGILMRILRGGGLDPAFGPEGSPIPDSGGDFGISVVPQGGRKALVLDLGFQECRNECRTYPKLVRFLEGPAKPARGHGHRSHRHS